MQLPTIHLNGTSKESLVADLCNASHAMEQARDALKQCAPNGRDYYPQGPQALEQAITEHRDRLSRLDSVKKEIDELTFAIDQL